MYIKKKVGSNIGTPHQDRDTAEVTSIRNEDLRYAGTDQR